MLRCGIQHNIFIQYELQNNIVLNNDDDDGDENENEDDSESLARVQLKSLYYTKPFQHGVIVKIMSDLNDFLKIDYFYTKLSRFLESKGLKACDPINGLAVKVFHRIIVTIDEFAIEESITQMIQCVINKQ